MAYDSAWVGWFGQIHAFVFPVVREIALRVDHVGSTAVPGLAAKPIIDMDVVVAHQEQVAFVKDLLSAIGYEWLGDLGVIGREAFKQPMTPELPEHHLYLVVEHNKAHLDHLLLRDLLREDADARRQYERLKRENASYARGDLGVYTARKAVLVAELLARARSERGLPPAEYWKPTPEDLGTAPR